MLPPLPNEAVAQERSAVLIAIGTDGKRSVPGVSVAPSEAEVHWRDFLSSLVAHGLHGTRFIVSDAHPGMAAARQAVFPSVAWQRCQFHLQQNAQAYVPRLEMCQEVAESIRFIFTSPSLPSAQASLKERVAFYSKTAPKLAVWMEQNLPQGFTVYTLPPAHHRRLRHQQRHRTRQSGIKRRTRVAALFPNEASLLGLVSALLCEQSDEWLTSKIHHNMNPSQTPSA